MLATSKQPLGPTVLRFAGIVQGLVALPCMIQLACSTYLYWSHCHDSWYFFTTHLLAASACLGIIFVASVQWKALTTPLQTLKLEAIKAAFAEALFLWVNFTHSYHVKRYIATGLATVVLFWAPLYYAYLAVKDEKRNEILKENETLHFGNNRRSEYTDGPLYADAPEKTPLLQSRV
ncbi:hypothetical protein IQ06DRAFT_374740 [Phaeosphaeriaceae sp. SRC1lsM3a]|nr:hypothetical protein IQ06DRAFT_374740 [Stagonospora sp. SRC1lsM3a]